MPFAIDLEPLHREKLTVGHCRCVVLRVAADAGYLKGNVEVLAVMGADAAVQGREREARCHDRRHNAIQGVLPGHTRTVRECLEDIERVLVERRDGGARKRVRHAHARYAGMAEQLPQGRGAGDRQTGRGLVVLRQKRILRQLRVGQAGAGSTSQAGRLRRVVIELA